jgi:hypothetical protein
MTAVVNGAVDMMKKVFYFSENCKKPDGAQT